MKQKRVERSDEKLANELHTPFKRSKQLRKVYFKSKENIWNADLIIMPQQNGHKYICYGWLHKICVDSSFKR